jgi:hypothetical protein
MNQCGPNTEFQLVGNHIGYKITKNFKLSAINSKLFIIFAADMKISNRTINIILAIAAGLLAVLCVLSIIQH